jgi:two-component system nitrogen regulation response regulator NtrX
MIYRNLIQKTARRRRVFAFPRLKDATDAYQREFILHKLAEADGNVARAAELMGVDRSHLYRRMKNLEITFEKEK